MTDVERLADLSSAVACYLRSLSAIADTLPAASPEFGSPYAERIARMRTRLSFDPTRDALRKSADTFENELKDFSSVAATERFRRAAQLEVGVLAISDAVESFARNQNARMATLRAQAAQLKYSGSDGESSSLAACIESMAEETAAVVSRLREEVSSLGRQIAGPQSTDPITGVLNRKEMERQIQAHRMHGSPFAVLVFELSGPLSDQLLRQAAQRISANFRSRDRVGRWTPSEFAVLFAGDRDIAQTRAAQVMSQASGKYKLDNGEYVQLEVRLRMIETNAQRIIRQDTPIPEQLASAG
jgi:GGDEF domain-containing protein